jgi:hypothetical protein
MGDAQEDRAEAATLPEGDIIRLLLEQHAQIKELFQRIPTTTGPAKADLFNQLRALLAVHETAEELVLRPVVKETVGEAEAEARNHEELEANKVLADLETLDVNSPDFDRQLEEFRRAVDEHAEKEEKEEFPGIIREVTADQRQMLGKRLRLTESIAPTHPHPEAADSMGKQVASAPFLSIVDRVKDALAAR